MIRYSGLVLAILSIPLIFYRYQQGDIIEALQSLGYMLGAFAFTLRPEALVATPENPRTTLAVLSVTQKVLFLCAIVLALLPFVAWYTTSILEIVSSA
jgi:hypothetical protein